MGAGAEGGGGWGGEGVLLRLLSRLFRAFGLPAPLLVPASSPPPSPDDTTFCSGGYLHSISGSLVPAVGSVAQVILFKSLHSWPRQVQNRRSRMALRRKTEWWNCGLKKYGSELRSHHVWCQDAALSFTRPPTNALTPDMEGKGVFAGAFSHLPSVVCNVCVS